MRTLFGNHALKAKEANKNSKTVLIFQTDVPKPVEDKGILWAPGCQVEVKCPPPHGG